MTFGKRNALETVAAHVEPNQAEALYTYKVAETREELEQVSALLERELKKPVPFSIYHALPSSSALICMESGKLLSCLFLISDSAFHLPLERDININSLKTNHKALIEIADLCFDSKDIRAKASLPYLLRYAIQFSETVLGYRRFFYVTWDKTYCHLSKNFGFELLNHEMPFFSKYYNKPDCYLYELNWQHDSYSEDDFSATNEYLADIFSMPMYGAEFPDPTFKRSSVPSMNIELLNYFFNERSQVFNALNEVELLKLRNYYLNVDGAEEVIPRSPLTSLRQEPRFQVRCEAVILDSQMEPTNELLEVVSVARNGLAFTGTFKPKKGQIFSLRVEVGSFILSDLRVKTLSFYNGITAVRIIENDHYWKKYLNFLCKSQQVNTHESTSPTEKLG